MRALKRTPLFPVYEKLGGKVIDFAGWDLPVNFAGIKEEHLAVRNAAGIFDVSHMGEIRVKGGGALDFLQYATTNDASRLQKGQSQYSALLNPEGGIIDDIFIYRLADGEYLLCVNAGNRERDFEWLSGLAHPGCEVKDESADWAQIAVQGPRAAETVGRAAAMDPDLVLRFHVAPAEIAGVKVLAARTGYTGEDGFELFAPAEAAIRVWDKLMAEGGPCGLVPCGLGARDTLRLEMGYPLHGHDITDRTTPLEADLAWIVASYKKDFVGKAALDKQGREGLARFRVGMIMEDSGIPRGDYRIVCEHGEGLVTSGTKTPSVDSPIAMGYVPKQDARPGGKVKIEIRGKLKSAVISKWPFYKPVKRTETVCAD